MLDRGSNKASVFLNDVSRKSPEAHLRDADIHHKMELSKNDPKKLLLEEKKKMREKAEA